MYRKKISIFEIEKKPMTEFEKMLRGELYNASDEKLVRLRFRARELTRKYNNTSVKDQKKRLKILRELLGSAGKNTYIEPSFQCDYGLNIYVGNNFYANFNCVILDVAEVIIGDNCFMGPQVGIYTATHPLDAVERNKGLEFAKKVVIGNNCWLGGSVVINPGVQLGDNVIVAAGSVVTKDFGDNVLIGGVPAKVIKKL